MGNKIVISVSREKEARDDAAEAVRCMDTIRRELAASGVNAEPLFIEPEDFVKGDSFIADKIAPFAPDCVFNLFEGFSRDSGKEIEFARILEKSGIPFTGNPARVLLACRDKKNTKRVLKDHGINVPEGFVAEDEADLRGKDIGYPLFVKPRCEDASVGIDSASLVMPGDDLALAVRGKLKEFPEGLIVEEFIPGREFNAGFIGTYPYELVGISSIDYSEYPFAPNFMSYSSKWKRDTREFKELVPRVVKDDSMDKGLAERIIALSRRAARSLGCRGYFRVDMREKGGKLYVLDVNPNPDITKDSGFMRQAYSRGLTYADVVMRIITLAQEKN